MGNRVVEGVFAAEKNIDNWKFWDKRQVQK